MTNLGKLFGCELCVVMPSALVLPPLPDFIQMVVSIGPQAQMVRIYAFPVIAFVQHMQTIGNWTDIKLVGDPMSFS